MEGCFYQNVNKSQTALYLLYFVYYVLSGLQIRQGYRLFKTDGSLNRHNSPLNLYIFMAYRFIPFLYEIQLILDWTITHTSLTLTEWFNLNEIYSKFYISKITFMQLEKKPLGQPIQKIVKLMMGWMGLVLMLGIIYGPLFLFSNLNPT